MLVALIRKEFLRSRLDFTSQGWMSVIKLILKLIFIAAFITVESFVFMSLDKKIREYSPYGTFDFLVLYCFVITLIVVIALLIKARKLLFNKKDNEVVMPLPISKEKIVFAKAIYLFIYSGISLSILMVPALICYGQYRLLYAFYYAFSFLLPWLISLFCVGLAFILAPALEAFYQAIKFSDILQFILACGIMIALCFAYQFVLNVFLTALSDSSVGGIFDKHFIDSLHNALPFFIPIIHVLNPILNNDVASVSNIISFIIENVVFFMAGFYISCYFYNFFNNRSIELHLFNKNKNEDNNAVISPSKALFKKEMDMLFKNDSYTFSYTSLLILAPFLSFVVISSLNMIIYDNLKFFAIYFPELVNGLNIALVLLFLTVINSSAALSMSREDKMIQIVKYLPISPIRQILIKLIVPISLSLLSLLITLVTLIGAGIIEPIVFGIALLLGVIIIIVDNMFSIEWDMHDKSSSKYKLSSLNSVLSISFPIAILVIHFAMSYTYCPIYSIYLCEAILGLVILIPTFINIKKRYIKAFKAMEVN